MVRLATGWPASIRARTSPAICKMTEPRRFCARLDRREEDMPGKLAPGALRWKVRFVIPSAARDPCAPEELSSPRRRGVLRFAQDDSILRSTMLRFRRLRLAEVVLDRRNHGAWLGGLGDVRVAACFDRLLLITRE